MSTQTNFHNLRRMTAHTSNGTSWLNLEDAKGNSIAVYMTERMAEGLADAWADLDGWEPEPPTYDEALGAKLDREAALDRQLRDAGRV